MFTQTVGVWAGQSREAIARFAWNTTFRALVHFNYAKKYSLLEQIARAINFAYTVVIFRLKIAEKVHNHRLMWILKMNKENHSIVDQLSNLAITNKHINIITCIWFAPKWLIMFCCFEWTIVACGWLYEQWFLRNFFWFTLNDSQKKNRKIELQFLIVDAVDFSGESNCLQNAFAALTENVFVLIKTETKGDQLSNRSCDGRESQRIVYDFRFNKYAKCARFVHVHVHPHGQYAESWIAVGSAIAIIDRFELLCVHASAFHPFLQLFSPCV